MNFFERYLDCCSRLDIEPCSQKAADMLGVTRATISTWGSKGITPKGETIAIIADSFGVSADYLLGRTDNPADHAKASCGHIPPVRKTRMEKLLDQLDALDRAKAEAYVEGLLANDKYKKKVSYA